MKIKSIFFSWDFVLALILSVLFYFVLNAIDIQLLKNLSAISISVLSIIFSVYFAALAIILSAGDNEFIQFLEKDGKLYSHLIFTFKFSLAVLFSALVYSIAFYLLVSYEISKKTNNVNELFTVIYVFLFLYSLFVSLNVILDSIKYAKYRTEFIIIKKRQTNH